jgi:ABC-type antimicrobial peptide transport system permease subunit
MALGAATRDVLRGVLRNVAVYAACGVALGVLGSIAMGRIVANLIVDVSLRDPWAISAAGVLLALVAVAAAVGPARRALAVSPTDALRAD